MARSATSHSDRDTIVARATANGDGAVAIVRLSGPDSLSIANTVFRPANGKPFKGHPLRTMVYGSVAKGDGDNSEIDQGLAVSWKGPASFTGEDVVEFHLHGSRVVVSGVADACIAQGARPAKPGEFTRRAFENGRIDLAQSEAICDLVTSRTSEAGRVALQQLRGGLSEKLNALREGLVPVIAELEAHIDFPDEDIEVSTRDRLGAAVEKQQRELSDLLSASQRGTWLRSGARVAFAGPPNAGKSSLFNALLKRERALVTPHAGTTRDTIEAEIDLSGIPITLVDTAGLRQSPEEIEALGIDRAREEFKQADLVLALIDPDNHGEALQEYGSLSDLAHLVVFTKHDITKPTAKITDAFNGRGRSQSLSVSTKTGDGMEALENAIEEIFGGKGTESEDLMVTNKRHKLALENAVENLLMASEGISSAMSPEFIVTDLVESVSHLDSITGRMSLDEDVLDQIFSIFCLGK